MHHYPPGIELPEAVYVPDEDGRYLSTQLTAGPWDPNGQHAGASAALLAHCMERHEPTEGSTNGAEPFLGRLTVDLLRPAPVAPLEVEVRTVRAGRRAHWLEATLSAEGPRRKQLVARASGLRVVGNPVQTGERALHHGTPDDEPPPTPDSVTQADGGPEAPWLMFWHGIDFRPFKGERGVPGPGGAWFNLEVPLIAGVPTSPLMRAITASDFALGISSVLDFDTFAYPNADLSVHLHRYPVGPWVALDATSHVDLDGGTALAEGALWDQSGRIGRAVQTLVVSPR